MDSIQPESFPILSDTHWSMLLLNQFQYFVDITFPFHLSAGSKNAKKFVNPTYRYSEHIAWLRSCVGRRRIAIGSHIDQNFCLRQKIHLNWIGSTICYWTLPYCIFQGSIWVWYYLTTINFIIICLPFTIQLPSLSPSSWLQSNVPSDLKCTL